jgi:DNA-directed RNA polymerase specialized sigma24 family protein
MTRFLSICARIDGRAFPVTELQQDGTRASASPAAEPSPFAFEGFEEFFRASFREVVRTAMIAGAKPEEAEDAAIKALGEMLPAWPLPGCPLAYARRAAVSNFIKEKTRGNRRVAQRLIDRGHVPHQEGAEDARLTAWEVDQWVADVLGILPPEQRKVMECIARGLDRKEIPGELGKSGVTIRQNLCSARARLAELLNPDGEPRQPSPAKARSPREGVR